MRIVDDGFEIEDNLPYSFLTGTLAWSTSIKRGNGDGGARSLLLAGDTIGWSLPATYSELYIRLGVYFSSISIAQKFLYWRSSGGTELGSLRYDPAVSKIKCYVGTSTELFTSATVVDEGAWYLLHLRIKIADSGGVAELKLNNVVDANSVSSGDTKPGADTAIGQLLSNSSASTQIIHLDDFAVNDTSNSDGLGETGYPANAYIIALFPNAAGDNTGLTPSTGSNWQNVDENPPSSADYNESASAAYDLYNLSTQTLLSGQTIVSYTPIVRAWGVGAGLGANINVGVKTTTEDWSGNQALPESMDEIRGKRYLADHAGGSLNQAFLNAIQVGFKVV